MSKKEITLHFDMDDEVQNRVYCALENLPEFYSEPDLSKAVIFSYPFKFSMDSADSACCSS